MDLEEFAQKEHLTQKDLDSATNIDNKFSPKKISKTELTQDDIILLHDLEKKNKIIYNDSYVSEFLKCRSNPLYFIQKYCYFNESGNPRLYASSLMNKKYRRVIKCLNRYENVILMASRQLGKALALNTLIPMYDGSFRKIKDVHPGDIILDENHNPTTVLAESKIFVNKRCFNIYFDIGETVNASEDHLWVVSSKTFRNKVLTTLELTRQSEELYIEKNELIKFKILKIKETKKRPCKCLMVDSPNRLFLITQKFIPTHNSTLAACLLTHAATFYSGLKPICFNFDLTAGIETIDKCKFILENLPAWMRFVPPRITTKTFIEFTNGSKISVFY